MFTYNIHKNTVYFLPLFLSIEFYHL